MFFNPEFYWTYFWPAMGALLAVVLLGTRWVDGSTGVRWKAPLTLTGLSGAVCLLLAFLETQTNGNLLLRDMVAWTLIGALIPALALGAQWLLRDHSPFLGRVGAFLAGCSLLMVSPQVILLVHCTSGDCL